MQAWEGVVGAPEASKAEGHQIVETEHLMRSLLNLKVRRGGTSSRMPDRGLADGRRIG